MSMLAPDFTLTSADISSFQKRGFLKLKSFFSQRTIDHLVGISKEAVVAPSGNYGAGFSKLKYDIGNDDEYLLSMMQDSIFVSAITALTERETFFTQGLGFELERNKSTGFPWHVGTQSFGFQRIDDFGFTIWTPLCNINTKGQRGGMAYVPKDVLSGAFIYQHINMLPGFIRSKIEAGTNFDFNDFNMLKNNILNSKEMSELLDFYAVEDDFEVGDALIFDKYVLHRSVKLEDGPMKSRLAYAIRFSGIDATYDKVRVGSLEYPRRLFNYDVASAFNDVICKEDGEIVFNSSYFDRTRERRKVSLVKQVA